MLGPQIANLVEIHLYAVRHLLIDNVTIELSADDLPRVDAGAKTRGCNFVRRCTFSCELALVTLGKVEGLQQDITAWAIHPSLGPAAAKIAVLWLISHSFSAFKSAR